MNHQISEKELNTKLEALAQEFGFETLKARNSDDLDFVEVSVWGLRELLAAAYQAGLKDAHAGVSAVAETTGVFQARICTLDGWQTVGTASTKREALALAEAACTKAGLDPEYCTTARQIA
ncbi:DUF6900 domain-containing protein [Schaalia hyovaginalis]|uniref:DUF6900 domain-containing protein n=1 Tax=Schaalia hyovaginalis TaxID=29316 RepID=A0A923E497_9ACTO|nr:hypothetical protein [Schaalia hyovaginalis]MBB6335664.1 hypothetical protein [Schaalia hyovaginalis]